MFILGLLLITLAIISYIANVILMKHYLDKNVPGLLEIDASLPPPKGDKEYLWEKTARTGIVPKWVSLIGLFAIPLFVVGIIIIFYSFAV